MKKWIDFCSPFADDLRNFLNHKRTLKRSYLTEEYALRSLDRYLFENNVTRKSDVTATTLEQFLASCPRKRSRSYNHLLGVIRRFFEWLRVQEVIFESPLRASSRRVTGQRKPFIFTRLQAKKLLDAASQLPDSERIKRRGATYRMIFALLYSLGLRVSEACKLRIADVDMDRQLLVIRESKFLKSRLVPFGPRMAQALAEYIKCLDLQSPEHPVFACSRARRKPISRNSVTRQFRQLMPCVGLDLKPGESYPRLHDLRHSMAVGTLLRWYREGRNPSDRLLHLSIYLGHSDPASTAVYLTITADLLEEANSRFEKFANSLIGGIQP